MMILCVIKAGWGRSGADPVPASADLAMTMDDLARLADRKCAERGDFAGRRSLSSRPPGTGQCGEGCGRIGAFHAAAAEPD